MIFRQIMVQTTSASFTNQSTDVQDLFTYELSNGQLGSWKRLSSYPATKFTLEGYS